MYNRFNFSIYLLSQHWAHALVRFRHKKKKTCDHGEGNIMVPLEILLLVTTNTAGKVLMSVQKHHGFRSWPDLPVKKNLKNTWFTINMAGDDPTSRCDRQLLNM